MASRFERTILTAAVAGGALAGGALLARRFRRDLDAARTRLAAVGRSVVPTRFGDVEYAERGAGAPLLVVHGIFQGCDGGLLAARGLSAGRRVIAPSRFGYLGSPLPPGASAASQADAFAALLDVLGIGRTDVIGVSAGTTSVLEFALRHPYRVDRLVVLSGNWPGSPTAVAPPWWARLFYGDVPMWLTKVSAPRAYLRLMGVPRRLPIDPEAKAVADELADSIFPLAPRRAGAIFDAFVSDPDVNASPLEEIAVPTLVIHARDDPLASFGAAERAAARISRARFLPVTSGGHLLLGQDDVVHPAIAAFLSGSDRTLPA